MFCILHLEDERDDAFLIERALKANGIEANLTLVTNRPQFVSALEQQPYDLVLADSGLPQFSALQALEMVRQRFPDLGFICVSGAAQEERVLQILRAGATGYVLKDQLWQLVAAVRQEQNRLRAARTNQGMVVLLESVQKLSQVRDLNAIMSIVRHAARQLTGADGATFVLREGEFCHYADEEAIAPLWKGQRFPLKVCISGWAMLNRQPAVIEDIYADPRIPADAYRPTFVKSLAMVPIRTEAPIGAIGNYWASRHRPSPEEVELLQALANTTAVAMENVQLYGELEERVQERTAELQHANQQLENVNRELESFSYAVSHDFAAPLRRIQGFLDILLQEYGPDLKEDGRDSLARVQTNVDQMRQLMDALLRLARVARTGLKKESVDLSSIASQILGQLSQSASGRNVEIQIAENVTAKADANLMRIVLENLLSNAWKYTSRTDAAHIEFGTVAQETGSSAFFVKDNGAGFDMARAASLFQPFHRLHSPDEFPGSGIGLTTVQRIIHRHGGRVWAQAQPNKGASFYFTVPA